MFLKKVSNVVALPLRSWLPKSLQETSIIQFSYSAGPPRQPRMPRIGPCQVLAFTLTLSQPGGQIMPTLYWGPWLAKIRRGGPV